MKKGVIIALVIAFVLILIVVGFFVFSNRNIEDSLVKTNEIVDCGVMSDPSCFLGRMTSCLPVTGILTATDGTTQIALTIIGAENGKCHFQRKINNVVDLNCLFPLDTMNWNTIDQTFGNDHGLQSLIDSSCTSA